MIWIGREAPPSMLANIFGVDSPEKIDVRLVRFDSCVSHFRTTAHSLCNKPKQRFLPILDTPHSTQIRSVIGYIQSQRGRYLQLQIVRQTLDPREESEFGNWLVEDKNFEVMAYVDFLCYVHRLIQNEINQNND